MAKKMNIKSLVIVCLISVVGLGLTPSIQELIIEGTGVHNATWPGNLTGSARAIFLLFPMFWTILMIAIPVSYVAIWLRGT